MEIFFNLVLLIVGLIGLIKASDVFVDAASSLAIKLRVPKMLIALTIAAFGTCARNGNVRRHSILSILLRCWLRRYHSSSSGGAVKSLRALRDL